MKETLRTMGASLFLGGLTTLLSVFPLMLSTTEIFKTVFWSFFALVILGFTHALILLPVVMSLVGPIATHHKEIDTQSTKQKQQPSTFGAKKKKIIEYSSASSTSSTMSNNNQQDEPIMLRSFSEEEQEEMEAKNKAKKDVQKKRTVPFLGPSCELAMIEEGPGSRPESTTSVKSQNSLMEAPSDEQQQTPRAALGLSRAAMAASLLGKLEDIYNIEVPFNCGAELDLFDSVATDSCKGTTMASPSKGELS